MANEYDALLGPGDLAASAAPTLSAVPSNQPTPASAPINEYDDLIDQGRNQQKQALQGSMFVATKTEPDRRAKAQQLADRMKIPVDVAERQYDLLTKREAETQTDYDSLIDRNPRLAKWLENPNNAAVARDDIDNLGRVERTVQDHSMMSTMVSALQSGMASMYSSVARVPALAYDAAALPQNLIAKYADIPELAVRSPEWLMNNPVAKYYDQAAQSFKTPEMDRSIIEEITKGNYSRAGMTLAAQFVANAPQQAAIIAGTIAGLGVPTLIGTGVTTAADANKQAQTSGVDPATATVDALTKGTIEAGFESLGTFGILHQWEGIIAKQYGKEVSKEVFKDFAKTIAYSVAAEGNEEALTSATQDLTDYITGVNPEALKGLAGRALDAGIVGGFSGGLMTGPSAVASGAHRGAQVRQSTLARDFYLAMGKSAEATKLRERLPKAKQDLIQEMTKGTPVETIFIAPEAIDTYFQSKKVNPTAAMQDIGVLNQYTEAKEAGHDVEIPLATWANKVVGTEHYEGLSNDIKFDPAARSVNELKAEGEQLKDELQKQSKDAVQSPEAAKELSLDESAAQVGESISGQLKALGEDPQQSVIFERGFRSLGERAGVDPLELFNEYKLRLQKQGDHVSQSPGVILNQGSQRFDLPSQVTVVSANPESIGSPPFQNDAPADSKRAFQDAAHSFAKENFQGRRFLNAHSGWEIEVSKKGLGKANNKAVTVEHNVALAHLDQLIQNAVYDRSEASADRNIAASHIFRAPMQIGDRLFYVRLRVNETRQGHKFYDQMVMESERPAGQIRGQPEAGGSAVSGPSAISIQDFQSDIQGIKTRLPLFQGAADGEARGRILLGKDNVIIEFSKSKDASTLFHEAGHFYLEVLGDLAQRAGATDQIKNDYSALLSWLGVESRDQIQVEQHEKFARGFEAYLMEGKAPSQALRTAFAKFRVWLLSVYKQIRALNVELTPGVRSVMDRMLATDEEIAAVKREMRVEPLFTDPAKVGMNDKQTHAYLAAIFDAEESAKEELNAKLMRDHARAQSAAYKEERVHVREAVEKEVSAQPVYQAIEKAKANKEVKLSRKAVEEYGKDVKSALPRGVLAAKGEGLHPDVAAPLLGYSSGSELISAFAKAEDQKSLVERTTDDRMAKLHPDLLTDGKLPAEALKAVHNRSRSKLLRLEMDHLLSDHLPVFKDAIRRVARRMPTDAQVREQAQAIIQTKAVKDMRPSLYQRAEVRAAKAAGVALVKGDIEAAFTAKRSELLNHELFRATQEARETTESAIEKFKKLEQSDETLAKSRDMDLVNTARAILADIGIGTSEKPSSEFVEKIRHYDPDMFETVQAIITGVSDKELHYSQLPYGDFLAVRDAVDALWGLSKSTRQIEISGQILDKEQVKADLADQIAQIAEPKARAGYNKAVTAWDKTKIALLSARASLTRVEAFVEAADVGNPNGPFRKYIWNPVSEATTQYRLSKQAVMQKFESLLTSWAKGLERRSIEAPEIGYAFRDKTELMMAVLHSGNDSNLDKLLRGRNWGEVNAEGVADRSRLDRVFARLQAEGTLTKADYDFAQSVWDLLEEQKPEAQKAHKAIHGYYFNEITANQVVTPFGVYRGGYIPAKVDLYSSEDASIRSEREVFEKNNNSFQFPTTGRGFAKSRTQAYAAPLSLEMSLLPAHLDSVLRFTHIEPTVRAVARIVQDKELRSELSKLDPTVGKELLTPWLQRAAQQKVVLPSDNGIGRAMDSVASYLRRSVAMQIMVGSVVNAAQQFTGVVVAASKVKPMHLRNAIASYVRDIKGTTEGIMEKSEWMRSTQGSTIYDTQEAIGKIILDPSTFESMRNFALKHTYFLQSATQNIVNTVVWSGAYEQAISAGSDEKSAVLQADSAVRLTQGTNAPEDISRFETGTPTARLFTQFAGYFNMLANLNGAELAKISRDVGLKKGAGRAFALYLSAFMIPAVLSELLVSLASGKGLDADDDGYLDDLLRVFFGSQFKTATALIPYGGQVLNAGLNGFNSNRNDDRLSISPVVSFIETMAGVPAEIYKSMNGESASNKRVVKDVLMFMGTASSLPIGPVGKPVGYLMDVSEGKAQPSGPLDAARGLVTGKPGRSN